MPYTGKKDKKLPDYVKKLSDKEINKWIAVWNSIFQKTKGNKQEKESKAFSIANGLVVKPHNKKNKMEISLLRFEDETEDDSDNPIVSIGKEGGKPTSAKIGNEELAALDKDSLDFLKSIISGINASLEIILESMTQERDVLNVVSAHLTNESTRLESKDENEVRRVKDFVDGLVGLEGKSGRLGEILLILGEVKEQLTGSGAVDQKVLDMMDHIERNTDLVSGASSLLEGALQGLSSTGEEEISGAKYNVKDNIDSAAEILFDAKGELGYTYGSIGKMLKQIEEVQTAPAE